MGRSTHVRGTAGKVYAYDAQTGVLVDTIVPEPSGTPTGTDAFGYRMAVDHEYVLVGAPMQNGPLKNATGAVFLYHLPSGTRVARVFPEGDAGSRGGTAVALDGTQGLVGAWLDDTYANGGGAAWLMDFSREIGDGYCGPANPNSTGSSASLRGRGFDHVSQDSFELVAERMPSNRPAYPLMSQTADFVPFAGGSQGNLCLGGLIGRFTGLVRSTGAGGSAIFPIPVGALPPPLQGGIHAGETWRFQVLFRDAPASNFTNGLVISFR